MHGETYPYDYVISQNQFLFVSRHFTWERGNQEYSGLKINTQGMVDGSASKPALRQATGSMVEKTDHDIATYLGAFGANLLPK